MRTSGCRSDHAEPEERAAVLRADVAPEEAPEELAIANYVGVNGHAESLGRQEARLPFPGCECDRRDRRVPRHRRGSLAPPPLAGRRAARRRPDRTSAGTSRPTPMFGGVGIFAGFVAGVARRARDGSHRVERRARRDPRGRRDRLRRGARRRPAPPEPDREARGADRGGGRRARERARASRSSATTSSPGRSGSSGSSGSRTPSTCSTTWTASRRRSRSSRAPTSRSTPLTEHENETVLVLALALGLACAGFLPFNLRPRRGAAVFMGDSGSQVIGFGLASLALAASWTVAGTTVATILLPLLVLAIPILDTTLVTHRAARREAARDAGRTRPHVAPARLLRALRDEGGAAARDRRLGDRRDRARLQRPRQRAPDGDRRARDLRPPRPVRELPERPRGALAARRRRPASRRSGARSSSSRAASSRCSSTSSSSAPRSSPRTSSPSAARGTEYERSVYLSALPILLATRYVFFVALGVYRRVWRYATARDVLPIAVGCVGSAVAACLILVALRPIGSFPAVEIFVVDAVLCTVARRRVAAHAAAPPGDAGAPRRPPARAHRRRRTRRARPRARAPRGRDERVVGFLDDNPRVRRRRILGISVVGSLDEADRARSRARGRTRCS